jgi:hypothetical protein
MELPFAFRPSIHIPHPTKLALAKCGPAGFLGNEDMESDRRLSTPGERDP